jgi:hypothetical protein
MSYYGSSTFSVEQHFCLLSARSATLREKAVLLAHFGSFKQIIDLANAVFDRL